MMAIYTSADFMILTKNTVQVAAAEKYRSRTLCTDQRPLFTKMGAVRKYPCPGTDSTKSHLTRQPVYPAFSRAKVTMPEMGGSPCRPLPNHSLIMGRKIVCFFSFSHCVLVVKAIQSIVVQEWIKAMQTAVTRRREKLLYPLLRPENSESSLRSAYLVQPCWFIQKQTGSEFRVIKAGLTRKPIITIVVGARPRSLAGSLTSGR